jgi:hypothetical protein
MFTNQEDLTALFLAALPDMTRVVLRDSCLGPAPIIRSYETMSLVIGNSKD